MCVKLLHHYIYIFLLDALKRMGRRIPIFSAHMLSYILYVMYHLSVRGSAFEKCSKVQFGLPVKDRFRTDLKAQKLYSSDKFQSGPPPNTKYEGKSVVILLVLIPLV
jgi:hypothetical protein